MFRFFPESREIELARLPARAILVQGFESQGFVKVDYRGIWQMFAASYQEYYYKISPRGLSSVRMIPDDVFNARLREFEAYCRAPERVGAALELVDLLVFQRDMRE